MEAGKVGSGGKVDSSHQFCRSGKMSQGKALLFSFQNLIFSSHSIQERKIRRRCVSFRVSYNFSLHDLRLKNLQDTILHLSDSQRTLIISIRL